MRTVTVFLLLFLLQQTIAFQPTAKVPAIPLCSSRSIRSTSANNHDGNGSLTHHGSTQLMMMDINIPVTLAGLTVAAGGILYISGAGDREKQRQYAEYEAEIKAREEERARKAYIAPRDYWTEDDLRPYDGTQDPDGPILIAADGKVFNVYKGRHFYGPGCEYHIFAGRDATRLLAKQKLEEETEEEKNKPLNMAERATLQGWMWTIESKYEVVGLVKDFDDQSTSTRAIS